MKEILPDGINMVNEDGDVVAMDVEQPISGLDELEQFENNGPAVDLGTRALALSVALDKYAHSNKMRGFGKTDKPNDKGGVEDARRSSWQDGDNALKEAYGYNQMVVAGESPVDVNDDFVKVRYSFKNQYLDSKNPKSASQRKKLRNKLERQ